MTPTKYKLSLSPTEIMKPVLVFSIILFLTIILLFRPISILFKIISYLISKFKKVLNKLKAKFGKVEIYINSKLDTLEDWAKVNQIYKYEPNLYQEYMYYKYYLKSAKWDLKKKKIKYIPRGLEDIAEKTRKDYLTSRLAGLNK